AVADALVLQPRLERLAVALQLRIDPAVEALLDPLPVGAEIVGRTVGSGNVAGVAEAVLLRAIIAEAALLPADIGIVILCLRYARQPINASHAWGTIDVHWRCQQVL